ncbi:MAG: hypothetical protein WA192_18725, partial [Candidatus Acidiferrales bacterium]
MTHLAGPDDSVFGAKDIGHYAIGWRASIAISIFMDSVTEASMRILIGALIFLSIVGCQSAKTSNETSDQPGGPPEARAEKLLSQMTLEEKISLIGGDKDAYSTHAIGRLGIPKLVMSDGPQGVRNYGQACSFPCGAALAATWDVSLAQAYGHAMG